MATYYISPTGNDTTGDGSSGTPWATLSKFLTSSSGGDTCECAAGTYTFDSQEVTDRTLSAATGATVIFDGGALGASWRLLGAVGVNDIEFTNIIGADDVSNPIFRMSTLGDATVDFTRCKFHAIQVYGFNDGGLFGSDDNASGNSYTFNLLECSIYNITKISGATGTPSMFGARRTPVNCNLTNCVVYLEDTVTSNLSALVTASIVSSDVNITYKNSVVRIDYALAHGSSSITAVATYSCFNGSLTGAPTGAGVITDDPLFVDITNGNFNLRPTSPCLNTGTLL